VKQLLAVSDQQSAKNLSACITEMALYGQELLIGQLFNNCNLFAFVESQHLNAESLLSFLVIVNP
jgi:hypothetical protein